MSVRQDVEELMRYGRMLDARPMSLGGRTVAAFLAERMLKVRAKSGAMVPLRPNRAQMEYEARQGQRNVVLKARQMGISTWIAGRLFLKTITVPGTMSVQVAHTQDAAESIFGMAHRFLALLPEFLREGALRTSKANTREICFVELDSTFRVESAGDPNAGRGLTITNLHCSEVGRWPGDATAVLQGLKAALSPQGELVLESTPQGAQGCFWEEWQRAEETRMVRHFFPWWYERSYVTEAVADELLTGEERDLMARHGLSREQIGYRRGIRSGFRELADQEYAEDADSCFKASGECCFDMRVVELRLLTAAAPRTITRNGTFYEWLPPTVGRQYVVAVDPAGGGADGDYSVAQVVELRAGLQCAELRVRMPVLELAMAVTELHRLYNRAWVVVERNNHGSGVLAHLGGMMEERWIWRTGPRQSGAQGWLTSTATRPAMLAQMGALLAETPELFCSERLLRECRSFVRLPNGRTGAAAGAHDDCVMAMAIAHAVRAELLERQ